MTSSPTSEPEHTPRPAKPGPTETIDLASEDTSQISTDDTVAPVAPAPAAKDAVAVDEVPPEDKPVPESAATDETTPVDNPASAKDTSVADTTPTTQDTPVDHAPTTGEPVPAAAATVEAKPVPPTQSLVKSQTVSGEPQTGLPLPTEPDAQVEVLEQGEDDEDDEDVDYDEILGSEPSDRYPTLFPMIGALLGLTAIAALILIAFALPAVKSTPHRLPIGVSGTTEFQTQAKQVLNQAAGPTQFAIKTYGAEAELRKAIENREIYGGLVLTTEPGVSMLVTSAGSAVAAQALSTLANSLAEGGQIPVNDVIAMPASDPRGEGLAAANLPLVIAAVLPAMLLIPLYRRRTGTRLAVTVGASLIIGLGLSATLNYVLGSTDGSNFLLVSVGLTAGVLATSLLLLGLFAVAGRVGVGVGAALLVLFAAPLSGLATAPEWLPTPWGDVGQLLPAGANGTLLRSVAYFDGHGWGRPTLVLAAWALIGLLLIGLGALINRRKVEQPVPDSQPQSELELDLEPVTT